MTLSTKVAAALSLVVAVVGGLAVALATERQASEQREQFRSTNLQALELLALAVAPAVAEGRHHRAQAVLDSVANFPERFPDVRALEVIDLRGRVLADLDPRRFGEPSALPASFEAPAQAVDRPSGDLELSVPVRLAHPIGLLRARLTEGRLRGELRRRQRDAALFVAATMAVIGAALYILHRRVLGGPIDDLAHAASELRAGHMSARATERGHDELGQLARVFNQMASHLEGYTEGLEAAVRARTSELQTANRRLEELATTDALTFLANRRHFEEGAQRAVEHAHRSGRPLSLLVADVDRFKSFNDRFGHAVGDVVLRHVADVLRREARAMDLVARIGGEEFVVLMPDTDAAAAAGVAERMRAALAEATAADVPEQAGRVTASFGVATLGGASERLHHLLTAADDALYSAKREGRNRVSLAPASGEPGSTRAT